jgi:hypothetical protein
MLLKWELGLEAANQAIRNGRWRSSTNPSWRASNLRLPISETEKGTRTAYIFFDLDDPAQIHVIAEPLFQNLSSKVEFIPVMNADELQRGLAESAQAKAYTPAAFKSRHQDDHLLRTTSSYFAARWWLLAVSPGSGTDGASTAVFNCGACMIISEPSAEAARQFARAEPHRRVSQLNGIQ